MNVLVYRFNPYTSVIESVEQNTSFINNVKNDGFDKYSIFSEVQKKDGSNLTFNVLSKPDGTEELIIFIANNFFFYKTYYIDKILEPHRKISKFNREKETISSIGEFKLIPILTLFSSEVFRKCDNRKIHYGLQYLDSSIWQRWIDVEEVDFRDSLNTKYTKTLKERLNDLFYEFEQNRELYIDHGSKEYCEFQTRLYRNSYLADFSTNNQGHAKYVTPFPFAKEGEFRQKIHELTQKIRLVLSSQKLKFRILFVDDNGNPDNRYSQQEQLKRIEIIKKILNNELLSDWFEYDIEQAFTIDIAKGLLQRKNFDFIFLDYLLGKHPNNASERMKGIELLNELESNTTIKYKRGVLNKHWILLSSSYPQAFLDDIKQSGLSLYTDYWVIERAGSPLYTPNAFLYSLVSMIESQLNEIKPETSITKIWENALNKLANGNKQFSRAWANNVLTNILNYWRKIESLNEIKGDEEKDDGSLFAESYLNSQIYIDIKKEYDNGLYGYVTHLLFMLSFSDGYEWEEMKTNLERIKVLVPEFQASKEDKPTGYEILNKRILKLKETFDGK